MANRIAVLGLGLIGGSLAMAIRRAKPNALVLGWDLDRSAAEQAMAAGAITVAAPDAGTAAAAADLVLVATPPGAIAATFAAITPHLQPGTLVSDVASTKARVMQWALALPPHTHFVGGHPMAGRETSGFAAADADLFAGAVYVLCPGSEAALPTMAALAADLGARPVVMDAQRHDAAVAAISHVPFLLAGALMTGATSDPAWPEASVLAASGFRDMVRLAGGDPVMYRDICLTNGSAIAPRLRQLAGDLAALADRLDAPEAEALERWVSGARDHRAAWVASQTQR